MKKKSVITMLVIFALGMPLVASGQNQRMERRPKKEMRDEFRPKAMQDKDFKMMCEVVDDASFTEKKIGVIKVACTQSLPASVFSNESTLRMRWPKYWSFSLSISPSNEHPEYP